MLTEVEPAVGGAVVLLVSWVTTADPAGLAGTVVVVAAAALAACRVDSDGFELPLPLGGVVVVGAGATVLAVAGAAVVGGVVVDTVVGALPAAVP